MVLAATSASVDGNETVSIHKCLYGQQMMDLLDRRKDEGLSAPIALLFLSPPQVNKTQQWAVDVIDDFGYAEICDRQGARFSIYAYRTHSELIFIDNALPDPSYVRNWQTRVQPPNFWGMDADRCRDFRCRIAAALQKVANDVLLPADA
jgi:hypothetical protein